MNKPKNRVAELIYDSMQDFNEIGMVNKVTMREFEELCLVPEYTGEEIKQIREKNKVSQGVFAAYLNASVKTIQQWEQNNRKPNGQATKLISLIEKHGLGYL